MIFLLMNIRLYKYISIDLEVVYKIACLGAGSWGQTDLDVLFIEGER
jgi:hypothetical protein